MDNQSKLAYETAVEMYQREHYRWRHWTLFFFGLIAGIFALTKKDGDLIPFWVSCFVASLISGAWVVVALSIRATTASWENVIKRIECNEKVMIFHAFKEELDKYNKGEPGKECLSERQNDFLKIVWFWKPETWQSVTITLTRLGVTLFSVFYVIGILASNWLVVRIITILLLIIIAIYIIRISIIFYLIKVRFELQNTTRR